MDSIIKYLAKNIDGLANFIQISVGANSRKLAGHVFLWADTPGFVIVPEKAGRTVLTHDELYFLLFANAVFRKPLYICNTIRHAVRGYVASGQ